MVVAPAPAPVPPAALLPSLVRALPLRVMVALFAAHQLVVGVAAALYEDGRIGTGLFKVDGEGHYYVYFSALVLLAGAVVAVVAVVERAAPPLTLGLAALLAFMAADEAFVVHEKLERTLHVDWPILYAPIMGLGGIVVLLLLRTARLVRFAAPAFVAGGACWATAVVLEKLQWTDGGKADHYVAMMIPEELLEATGSFLFALALVLLLRAPARVVREASRRR